MAPWSAARAWIRAIFQRSSRPRNGPRAKLPNPGLSVGRANFLRKLIVIPRLTNQFATQMRSFLAFRAKLDNVPQVDRTAAWILWTAREKPQIAALLQSAVRIAVALAAPTSLTWAALDQRRSLPLQTFRIGGRFRRGWNSASCLGRFLEANRRCGGN
jgi:hypothetical protein